MTNSKVALYIEAPSHHFREDRLFNVNDGRLNGEQILAPYAHVRETLTARGIPVHTADYLPEKANGTRNIYVSMGLLDNYPSLAGRPDVSLSAYFAMECPIVEPSLFRKLKDAEQYFKRIMTWSDGPSLERFVGASLRCEHFCWPQSFDRVHAGIWDNAKRKFMVMINSNKLPRLYWQELYTERLKAVEYFSRTGEIDLYGVGWDKPSHRVGKTWEPYTLRRIRREALTQWQKVFPDPMLTAARRVYKGTAKSKSETLGQYSFALCFENMILKGWITEKIFDCFFAGAIPIYWGAPDIEDYVPANCFIDMRRFKGYDELADFLRSLRQSALQEYRDNARAFIASPQYYPFSKQAFTDLICRMIESDSD